MGFFTHLFPRLGGHFSSYVVGGNKQYRADQRDFGSPFEQGYARASDVYAITKKIADSAKTVPIVLKKQTGDKVEDVNSGALFDLINNPNELMDRSKFTEMFLLNLLLSGNSFTYSLTPVGFPTASKKYILPTQFTHIEVDDSGMFRTPKYYEYSTAGRQYRLNAEDVGHTIYANPTEYGIQSMRGLSPLTAGYLTLRGLVNNQTASASILDNQGASGVMSNESDSVLTPEEQEVQQQKLDEKIGGAGNFGKIIQSFAKVKFIRLGLDPSQLKIIESKVLKMRDLCNIYNVSSVLFNDPQNRIQANLTPAETAFWLQAVIPNLNYVKAEFQRDVDRANAYEFPNGRSRYFLELDTSQVLALKKDEKTKAETADTKSQVIVRVLESEALTAEQKAVTLQTALEITAEEAERLVSGS